MATVFEAESRVDEVHIEGLALLKIVRHCHDSLPQMVTGSLLGLVKSGTGILEITHAFPFPDSKINSSNPQGSNQSDRNKTSADALKQSAIAGANAAGGNGGGNGNGNGDENDDDEADGHQFQMEMMRMLREVNVDNNCVGWYQSMYLGIYSTSALLENQWSYQTELSANSIVLMYDPMQTANGNLVLNCYRLTEHAVKLRTSNKNEYIKSDEIFEKVPVTLSNPGLVQALLSDIQVGATKTIVNDGRIALPPSHHHYFASQQQPSTNDGGALSLYTNNPLSLSTVTDTNFDRLDLSTNPYLEKHLEFLCSWVDDLSQEQQKFQYYARHLNQKKRDKKKNNDAAGTTDKDNKEAPDLGWESADAPKRIESLLVANQIHGYCNQMDKFTGGGLGKLFLAGGLHKEEEKKAN